MNIRDFSLGAIWAVTFTIILVFVIPHAIIVPSSGVPKMVSPRLWPELICYLNIIAAILVCIRSIHAPLPGIGDAEEELPLYESAYTRLYRVVAVILMLFGTYFAVEYLGVILSSALGSAILMVFFGERNWWLIVASAFGLSIVLYLFFAKVADVQIPHGILFGG